MTGKKALEQNKEVLKVFDKIYNRYERYMSMEKLAEEYPIAKITIYAKSDAMDDIFNILEEYYKETNND